MTSRNEVRIDIEVEGGAKAERSFNRAEKGARGLGRSTRGLINPLIGASLFAGVLGGGLVGLALSSGAASNSLIRIQGSLEGLIGTFTRKLEPAIDFAAGQFEKLPIGAQLGVLGVGAILGIGLVKVIGAAGGAVAEAVAGFVSKRITAPLRLGLSGVVRTVLIRIGIIGAGLVAGVFSVVALAVAAVVVSIGSLAFIAWDLIFNDGRLLKRFEDWLNGMAWVQAITEWVNGNLDQAFLDAWNAVIGFFDQYFAGPIITAWETVRDELEETFGKFFTQTIPVVFNRAWDDIIGFFVDHFSDPIVTVHSKPSKDIFKEPFTTFFHGHDPWDIHGGLGRRYRFLPTSTFQAGPIIGAWETVRDLFQGETS